MKTRGEKDLLPGWTVKVVGARKDEEKGSEKAAEKGCLE